jgi:hypothetical protein
LGAFTGVSAIEFVTIEDDTLGFGFAQENVDFSNYRTRQVADGQ